MILITTTEKWIEFSGLDFPIKKDDNIAFLNLKLERKGEIEIGFDFGSIVDNDFVPNNIYRPFQTVISKTNAEIEGYGYSQLHIDAKAFLESKCITQGVTFDIL